MRSNELEVYPWQHDQWISITKRVNAKRMPHALLLAGPVDVGKHAFAKQLAHYMLCQKRTDIPCGHCKDCLLFAANTHPDALLIIPEEKHKQIKVQQVRNIVNFLSCRANKGGYRVVIISPAEGMNIYAANALLKSLEEPGENTVIILVSQRSESLLATVRSRCQQVLFSLPNSHESAEWLKKQLPDNKLIDPALFMANGRPLAALRYIQQDTFSQWTILEKGLTDLASKERSLAEISESWMSLELGFIFEWMVLNVSSMICCNMTKDESFLKQTAIKRTLHAVSKQCNAQYLMKFYDWLVSIYQQITTQINFNSQLLIEALLIRWQEISLS